MFPHGKTHRHSGAEDVFSIRTTTPQASWEVDIYGGGGRERWRAAISKVQIANLMLVWGRAELAVELLLGDCAKQWEVKMRDKLKCDVTE